MFVSRIQTSAAFSLDTRLYRCCQVPKIAETWWRRWILSLSLLELYCISRRQTSVWLFRRGRTNIFSDHWPQHIGGVIAVEAVDATAGGLRHEAVIPREGEVGDVDVEGGLEEHRALALQVRRTGPEPAERLEWVFSPVINDWCVTDHLGRGPVLAVEVR